MAKRNLSPYLNQALAVLNRTAGVAPARIRAIGFLQQRLRARAPTEPTERDRTVGPALRDADDAGRIDRR